MVHLHPAQANLTFSAISLRTIKKKSRNALLYNIPLWILGLNFCCFAYILPYQSIVHRTIIRICPFPGKG